MIDKVPELMEVLNKVWKTHPDAKLQELIGGVMREITSKPKMEIGISKSDQESIVFTSPQGRSICTTLGRLMTRHLGYDPKKYSLAIQVLTDAYIAEVRRASVSFDIVDGSDIMEAYRIEWGAHSCMTGEDSKYTKFMAKNKKVASMLLFKDKTTKARALLWNTVQGVKVLDRIYPNSGWHIKIIKEWAHKLGMVSRVSASLPSGDHIALSDNKRYIVMVHNEDNIWAYMDTFTFGIRKDESMFLLSNSHELIDSKFSLQTTGGRPIPWPSCSRCHKSVGPTESDVQEVFLHRKDEHPKIWCADCVEGFAFMCDNCGKRIVRKEAIETLCDYCKDLKKRQEKEDVLFAAQPSTPILRDDTTTLTSTAF